MAGSTPALAPLYKHITHTSVKSSSTSEASSRQSFEDNAEIQHNLAKALSMNMPLLENRVTITRGPSTIGESREEILPLSRLPAIKATRRTEAKVEYLHRGSENVELLKSIRRAG